MAQNFEVNYDIRIGGANDAVTAINNFANATHKLEEALTPFRNVNKAISNLKDALSKLNSKNTKVNVDTSKAIKNIDMLLKKMRQLESASKRIGVSVGGVTGAASTSASKPAKSSSGKSATATTATSNRSAKPAGRTRASSARNSILPKNLGYKLLGPTPLDTGGIMAVDMLKGMGIAYGIAGIGSLISNSVKDFTEYDNIMKTAQNILGAHDKRKDFDSRFGAMQKQVRNVGVETKFTAPQVADAAKFLAMAGFNVDAITKSIAPIADIALVGDTDLGETADVVTNIMTGYNISPDKVRNAADIMTMTFTKSNTTLMEIAEAYKYSASLLSAGNMPFEEATAAMGILGNAGIKGSQAGTTMRTIMANIVNPTKKQLKAWNRIGVSRTDKNGNMRDVVSIFEDLNKKDLSLADYYQIFHKTAAQGAVSLADNVNEWNNIIKANFMSDGLAKELADEKKNTIQGLWAQLTSAFTEDGIEAFEKIQQPIKDFLLKIINWLKTDEAKNFIQETARDLMGFAKIILDVTKKIFNFYNAFSGVIKLFVTFQLHMWPILNLVRVVKAMTLGVGGVLKFASSIKTLTTNVRALGISMTGIRNVGLTGVVDALTGNVGLGEVTPVGNKVALKGYGPAVGGFIGGLSGASVGETLGGIQGSVIGGTIGSLAPMLAFMHSNQAGIYTSAILGLCGITNVLYSSIQAWTNATNAAEEYRKSVRMVDGVLTGEGLSNTESYLNIVYNKELSTNDLIKERLRLRRLELGLLDPGSNNDASAWDGAAFKEAYNKWSAVDGLFHPNGAGNEAEAKINGMYGRRIVGKDTNGYRTWNGHRFNIADGTIGTSDELAAYAALHLEGQHSATKVKDAYQNRLAAIVKNRNSTYADVMEVYKDFQNRYVPKGYDKNTVPEYFTYKLKNIYDPERGFLLSNKQLVDTYPYQEGLYNALNPIYGQKAKVWDVAKTYYDNVNNGKLTENQVVDYIKLMDITMGDFLKEYTSNNINAWLKAIGFDPAKGTFVAANGLTGEENAKNATTKLSELITIMTALGTPAEDAAKVLWALAKQLNAIAGGVVWNSGNSQSYEDSMPTIGATKTVSGTTYKFDGSMWTPQGSMILRPVDNKTMQGMARNQKQNGNPNQVGTIGRNGRASITPAHHNGKVGASQADYKQHYNNKTAAPKQVIVKIENLMNVKSIDLSKKDNQEVIDNVKAQLTQALVDVVHDFDDTWNG